MTGDEGGGRQIENQTAIHLGIEGEVEVIEVFLWIAKLGLLAPTFQQAIAATDKFVGRFNLLEDELRARGKKLGDVDLAELDAIWNEIKKE